MKRPRGVALPRTDVGLPKRMAYFLDRQGFTVTELAEYFLHPRTTVSSWIFGTRRPGRPVRIKIEVMLDKLEKCAAQVFPSPLLTTSLTRTERQKKILEMRHGFEHFVSQDGASERSGVSMRRHIRDRETRAQARLDAQPGRISRNPRKR